MLNKFREKAINFTYFFWNGGKVLNCNCECLVCLEMLGIFYTRAKRLCDNLGTRSPTTWLTFRLLLPLFKQFAVFTIKCQLFFVETTKKKLLLISWNNIVFLGKNFFYMFEDEVRGMFSKMLSFVYDNKKRTRVNE